MKVVSPTGYKIHYPSSTTPNDFYCNEIEVKQDGRLLPPLKAAPPGGRGSPACGRLGIAGAAESSLAIHLQYSLTEPGTYTVRFTRYSPSRKPGLEIAEQSEWIALRVRVAPADMVEHWLTRELSHLPNAPGPLLGEVLPSVLASRDLRVLQLMIEECYHTDSTVAAYAANSLGLFDPEQVRTGLLSLLRERGPSEALGYFFGSQGNIVAPIAGQIVASSLPYLGSSRPEKVTAAVHVLSIMSDHYFHQSSDTDRQIASALQSEVDFVVAQKNEKAAWWIANFLGQTRPVGGRALLWKLIDARLATEQSLICVTWFHDPSDLPRLTAIVKERDASDPPGYDSYAGVVGDMHTNYRTLARSYLRDILASAKQPFVRAAAAQALAEMNDRAGWEFFFDVIQQRPFYRDEMVRWLGDRFPTMRSADDTALTAFLRSKMATATTQE